MADDQSKEASLSTASPPRADVNVSAVGDWIGSWLLVAAGRAQDSTSYVSHSATVSKLRENSNCMNYTSDWKITEFNVP